MTNTRLILVLTILITATFTAVATPAAADRPVDDGGCGPIEAYNSTDAYQQCLLDHVDTEDILYIIDRPPADATQTEVDAVFLVPQHWDEYNLSESEKSRVVDWMTWETTGVKPPGYNTTEPQSNSDGRVRSASLAIRQPAYVSGDVEQLSSNGTPIYEVAGERLTLTPQNFDPGNVQDFGTIGSGELAYDPEFQDYTFHPNDGPGTYTLFWIVNERVPTTNGTTTVAVEYQVKLRVTGETNLIHRTEQDLNQLQEDAQNWREFNATRIENNLFTGPGVSTEESVQAMVDWAQLHPANEPLQAIAGGFIPYIILGVTSAGAALVWAIYNGYHAVVVTYLKRKLNIHEAVEAEEGTAVERIERLTREERNQIASQRTPYDIEQDDHAANAMAEAFGENLLEAGRRFQATFLPRNVITNRLKAMGQNGWVIEDTESGPVLRERESLDDPDGDIIELDERLDADTVTELDWGVGSPLYRFDLPNADYDAGEADVEFDIHDVDELAERFRADMQKFDDAETFSEYLLEFANAVRNHPMTDPDGSPNSIHYTLETLFNEARVFDDDLDWPGMHYIRDAIARALVDYDPEADALAVANDVTGGG